MDMSWKSKLSVMNPKELFSVLKSQYKNLWVEEERELVELTDLEAALQFLPELDNITLAVDKFEYVPYIKRYLLQNLGQPGKMYADKLFYGGKCISIISLVSSEEKLRGIPEGELFYVKTWDRADLARSRY